MMFLQNYLSLQVNINFKNYNHHISKQQICLQKYWSDNPTTFISLRQSSNAKNVNYVHGRRGLKLEKELTDFETEIRKLLMLKK